MAGISPVAEAFSFHAGLLLLQMRVGIRAHPYKVGAMEFVNVMCQKKSRNKKEIIKKPVIYIFPINGVCYQNVLIGIKFKCYK